MDANEAPAETQDTPQEEPQVDPYEKRYNDLRPQFDRTTQELAQAREAAAQWERFQSDPNSVLAELGYQVETDDDESYVDPTSELAQKYEQLEQRLTAREQQEAEQARLAEANAFVEREFATLPDVDKDDRDWLLGRAMSLPPTADGMPDIKAAHAELVAWEQARQKRWAQTKRGPRTPLTGTQATHELYPEGLSRSELAARMAEQVMAAEQQ